jgi:hypothetical protein
MIAFGRAGNKRGHIILYFNLWILALGEEEPCRKKLDLNYMQELD